MNKLIDNVITMVNIFGVAISLQDINETLNVIILILSIIGILWRIGYTIYTKIKNKKYDEIEQDIQSGINDIRKLTDKEDK